MLIPGSGSCLSIYLNDHLTGAIGGCELAARVARSEAGGPHVATLQKLSEDVAADKATLLSIMKSVQAPVRRYKMVAGWTAEKVGRAKLNGHLLDRSPLSDLIEIEALQIGVHGKAAGWRSLRVLAETDTRLDIAQLDHLIQRAESQCDVLETLHSTIAETALNP